MGSSPDAPNGLTTKELVEKEAGIAAKPIRILLPKDTYPKVWKHQKDA